MPDNLDPREINDINKRLFEDVLSVHDNTGNFLCLELSYLVCSSWIQPSFTISSHGEHAHFDCANHGTLVSVAIKFDEKRRFSAKN